MDLHGVTRIYEEGWPEPDGILTVEQMDIEWVEVTSRLYTANLKIYGGKSWATLDDICSVRWNQVKGYSHWKITIWPEMEGGKAETASLDGETFARGLELARELAEIMICQFLRKWFLNRAAEGLRKDPEPIGREPQIQSERVREYLAERGLDPRRPPAADA